MPVPPWGMFPCTTYGQEEHAGRHLAWLRAFRNKIRLLARKRAEGRHG
jgi:hypothetical protein